MLSNQFQTRAVEISQPNLFCNAVDKNGEGIDDPAAHLTCYNVKKPRTSINPHVITTDQFGEHKLRVLKRRTQLCVPSAEVGQPAPTLSLESFELYKTKRAPQTPRFDRQEVDLSDQYLDETIELNRPSRLGVPTDNDNGGITNPLTHLTCYSMRAAPRFKNQEVEVVDQFGQLRLSVKRPKMLCVPSYKQVVP
jgi:hypothetical protein